MKSLPPTQIVTVTVMRTVMNNLKVVLTSEQKASFLTTSTGIKYTMNKGNLLVGCTVCCVEKLRGKKVTSEGGKFMDGLELIKRCRQQAANFSRSSG